MFFGGVGYDYVVMPNDYVASTFSASVGSNLPTFGCFENHGLYGNTRTTLKVNVYDFLENLKFKDMDECQWEGKKIWEY